jgi:tripartite-type tricarboxylate transporter receptor subunit TctC
MTSRRNLLRVLSATAAAAALSLSGAAQSQAWPNKPIRIVNVFGAGGPGEILGRTLATKMTETLGTQVIVESRPGAGGAIATAFVAKAAPDGYTILLSHLGSHAIVPALRKDPGYDPVKDFEAISQVSLGPTLLVVRNDIPVKNVKELIDYAKANPGKLSFGSVGIGSTTHLAGEMLAMAGGVEMIHVPYKSGPEILNDMLGGRLSMAFIGISGVIGFAEQGRVRPLGVSTIKRSVNAPHIPAVSETLPGFDLNSWYGLAAPAGTPRPIVTRLNQAVNDALKKPEVIDVMKKGGIDPNGTTPEESAAFVKAEVEKWAKVVKAVKLAPN